MCFAAVLGSSDVPGMHMITVRQTFLLHIKKMNAVLMFIPY